MLVYYYLARSRGRAREARTGPSYYYGQGDRSGHLTLVERSGREAVRIKIGTPNEIIVLFIR